MLYLFLQQERDHRIRVAEAEQRKRIEQDRARYLYAQESAQHAQREKEHRDNEAKRIHEEQRRIEEQRRREHESSRYCSTTSK